MEPGLHLRFHAPARAIAAQGGTSLELGHTNVTTRNLTDPEQCHIFTAVLARIGDKWPVLVVMFLRDGPKRFAELKRAIGSVSQRLLTLTLRAPLRRRSRRASTKS